MDWVRVTRNFDCCRRDLVNRGHEPVDSAGVSCTVTLNTASATGCPGACRLPGRQSCRSQWHSKGHTLYKCGAFLRNFAAVGVSKKFCSVELFLILIGAIPADDDV